MPITTTGQRTAQAVQTLNELATQINQAHLAAEQSVTAGLAYAIAAGKLLAEAKERVKRKQWGVWLKANCPTIAERTDQMYRKIAKDYDSDPQRVAGLSLREAVRSFSKAIRGIDFIEDIRNSSDSQEWYTPKECLEKVQEVLGTIDLDPCSNKNKNVPARAHYTKEDDGLEKPWKGAVFLNPPYGKGLEKWVGKLIDEYERGEVKEAIALVPGYIERQWFGLFRNYDRCHLRDHLSFIRGDGKPQGDGVSPHATVLFYLGKDRGKFFRAFAEKGDVLRVIRSEEEATVGFEPQKPVAMAEAKRAA